MKQLRSILILPATVVIVIPSILVYFGPPVKIGWGLVEPYYLLPIAAGSLLLILGLGLMVHTIRLIYKTGRGTLAPWDPTQKLVVTGLYRYLRNPMISGVIFVLLGQAVLLGSWLIFIWFLIFLALNIVYIPLSEEPGLENRFGDNYRSYKDNVPRWLPRRTPWETSSFIDTDRFE
jgi:protein-S-isoprenylcysteine O-methyltransferase Ste14